VTPILWSGFRGRERNAVLDDVRINTDWNAAKPVQVWRRSVGPGWSSFAVAGELIFTQEQRGDSELISAYRLRTGEPVWRHQDAARFYESAGGAGPRGTPTVHDGRVYAMGATGIVNALDARTGARIWTRNAERDTGARRPDWGFAASPLVVGDVLVAAASGRLAAYDLTSGTPRWTQKTNGGGYSSPHLATLAGVPQILLMNGGGITSVGLDGSILWANHSEGGMGVGILQPQVLDDGSVLAASGEMLRGLGVRRLAVSRAPDGTWKVEERWTSRGLKPYFNDFVVHKGHAYGFDGTILSAINLETGERVWKGGRYGAGQMLLLPQQDLLLVVSEEGDLVLVAASPDQHTEIAKFKAIEGKTWNHPVLVGDVLLVRNGEEMAAFRLPR
jgi:outer membrane protein assembly factor BamB